MTQPAQTAASIELHLKAQWTALLDVTAADIAADSNFFGLGGNSMLILSLHLFIVLTFNISLTLAELFDNPEFGSMSLLVYNKALNTTSLLS